MGSHEVVGKGYVNTKSSQTVSIGAIFTFMYNTKQLNPWPNSSASRIVNYSPLSSRLGEMEPFEDNLSTRRHLTADKPQKQATAKAA